MVSPEQYNQLKQALRQGLIQGRQMKDQTERHLQEALADNDLELQPFLDGVLERLEDYEIEIIFGPLFTPKLDELATYSELLFHCRPTQTDLEQLVAELTAEGLASDIVLPDDHRASLPLHQVLIERYVRLLRLYQAPAQDAATIIRDALPAELWNLALALARQRCWNGHQDWYAAFLLWRKTKRPWGMDDLSNFHEFIDGLQKFDVTKLVTGALSTLEATRIALSKANLGRMYLSSNVAEHHSFHGSGEADHVVIERKRHEVVLMEQLTEDLREFLSQKASATGQV